MSNRLKKIIDDAKTVVLLGHVRPDGDCIGSCLGMYNYLTEQFPELSVDLYLDHPTDKFAYLTYFDKIKTEKEAHKNYDLCITLDSSDIERLGVFVDYFKSAKRTFCLDHHITNRGFAQENEIQPTASSSGEVLYTLLEDALISKAVAECIYTGIIHDTGVFKHSNTSAETMRIAGKMIEKGIDCGRIIDDSFYRKTYIQNQIMGRALIESIMLMDGRCIFSAIKSKDLEFYGADSNDLDGIIDQMRITEGVECAIFIYETGNHDYKISMRSNTFLDVSKIASYFGGGGHVKAAGCTISGSIYDVLNNLLSHIEEQFREHDGVTE
ncbi:MAG: bifunctional oligoribonuclease/PAP phosphatase NrnA [Clostridium sp.]